jgi:hypothetical protein
MQRTETVDKSAAPTLLDRSSRLAPVNGLDGLSNLTGRHTDDLAEE